MNPKSKSELSDTRMTFRPQAENSDQPNISRLEEALAGRDMAWLHRKTGIPTSTLWEYGRGKFPKADKAVDIAEALGTTVEWLFGQREARPNALVSVDNADWVSLPRFDLRQLSDSGKGDPVEAVPFRRDWLNRRLLTSSGLWLTELPSDYDALDLAEGDAVICSDIVAGAGPEEKWICIFRGAGAPFVGVYRSRPSLNLADEIITPADLATGEIFAVARIHARLLAKL